MSEREEFEAYYSDGRVFPRAVERDSNGNYRLNQTQSAWLVWQAARAYRPAQQPSLYGIEDEARIRSAISVMDDVLNDISEWEDTALAGFVAESRSDLLAIADSIAFQRQDHRPQRVDFLHRALLTKLEELQKRAEERRQKYGLGQQPREGLTMDELADIHKKWADGCRALVDLMRATEQALAAKWGVVLKGKE